MTTSDRRHPNHHKEITKAHQTDENSSSRDAQIDSGIDNQ